MFSSRVTESPIRNIGSSRMVINSTNSINCNLCGSSGSSVKCDRCDSKTFCISCDDMYHRHPKRRFHLRKTINQQSNGSNQMISPLTRPFQSSSPSPSPSPSLSSVNVNFHSESRLASSSPITNNTIKSQSIISQFQSSESSHHHPSKMPIPPPRRKKKPQEDPNGSFLPQFGQTRVIQYQSGSNYRSVDHLNQSGQYFNDQQSKHQQSQPSPNQQQRLNYNYLRPFDEEYRRGSSNIGTGSSNLSSANSSSLSSEQWSSEVGSAGNVVPPALPLKKKWSQSLPRKNLSLMDLNSPYINSNQYYHQVTGQPVTIQEQMIINQQQQSANHLHHHNQSSMINHPALPPHHPMNFGASPYHHQQSAQLNQHGQYHMGSVSLAQSMEDLGLDDRDDQVSDEDFPDHGTLTRNKSRLSSLVNRRNGSMKRSQSSYLVNQQWQQQNHQQPMVPPYWINPVYPMYSGGYPMIPGGGIGPSPLPPSSYNNLRASPSPSLRSLNLNRPKRSGSSQSVRSSVVRESSPGIMRKSSVSSSSSSHHRSHPPHPHPHHHQNHSSQSRNKMFDQRSTSIPRSLTSSRYSMRATDSEDEDDYASQSEDDEIDEEDDDRFSQASSLEPNKLWTCYACTYVNNPNAEICEMCGKSHPSRLKRIGQRGKQPRPMKEEPTKENRSVESANQSIGKKGPEVVITSDLIREQMEIEKELRRRLENEKRVERENRRLERKEERKRKQSISSSLIDENEDNDNDDNQANQLIASTSSQRKEPVPLRIDSMRNSDDFMKQFKTNNGNYDDNYHQDNEDDDDDGHLINSNNKAAVKHLDKAIDSELDWPDSVRKRDSIDKHQNNKDNKKEGERSMSPLSSNNFKDIEETFEKLEQEIDLIRNSTNKRATIKEAEPVKSETTTIKVNDEPSKQQQQPIESENNEITIKSDQQIKQQQSVDSSSSSTTIKNDQGKDLNENHNTGLVGINKSPSEINQANKPVDFNSNELSQPLITPQALVNQPINQNPQLGIAGSPIPLNLPAIYHNQQQQQTNQQIYPSYPNQYPMMGQQLNQINSSQSIVSPGSMFPSYDVNRLRSNNYIGLNSPNCEMINHPLAVYAGSNYLNSSQSMYNLQMANIPMNQLPSHQTIPDHNQPLFPGTRTEPNALSYLGHSSGFNGKFMSNENLSIDNRTNQSAASVGSTTASISSAQSQLQSGFQMFKLLRDAEKKGFTADDIEIALTFNSTSPLDWLDENWNNMIETVLTLSNNQLVQNEKKRLGKKYKLTAIDLVTTKDAKLALRLTKGNIWQAIDKCVQRKEEDKSDEKKDVKSFSLDIEESGSGKSNMDAVPIALLTNQNQQNQESIRLLQCSSSSLRNDKNELKADEITLSRSSSSSGEYFSEPSDDNEDEMREKINVGTNVNDEDEDEDEDDDRLVDIEVKYLDAVNEVEEIEENILIEEEEEDIEDDEENVDEIDGDEDEENEELVRLRSDSVEDKETDDEEDNDNEDRDYDEDEDEEDDDKEMEDYENLRKSLEQRLSQLGINSIDGYNDDSDEDGNHEDLAKSDKSQEEDEEINRDFEILNRDDFDSNDSDKWSQQSEEDESNHEPIKESMETLKTSSQSETTINITESSSSKEHQKVNQEKQSDNQETQSIGNIENPLEKKVTKSLKKKVVPLTNLKEKVTVSEADGSNGKSTLLPVTPITELPVIDKESLNPHFGYARSAYECELCAGSFHIRDMVSMISCTHKACVNCLRQYFSVQIREASVFIITCPFCSEPVISSDDEDSVCDYLSLLDQLVKSLVSADLHELWQRKVRDKVLSKDPSFRWCTNCSSGFIASNPAAKTITCPDCKIVNCASCHKIWEDQHTGITCDQFTEWKRLNDPEYSDNQLELHLKQFGIDCPNCNFHYELSKGGCMHFHCVQCSHDFCGGCRQTFRLGSKCKISNWCDKLGLHAHHPRNCLFYLRDKEVNELRQLLDIHKIEYKYHEDKQSTNESRVCMIMEQKEYPEGLKDLPCGNNLETAGVCKQHYIEYLGGLIFEHGIDPIEIFTEDELVHVLRRDNLILPIKKNGQDYRTILYEIIRKECPLIREPVK